VGGIPAVLLLSGSNPDAESAVPDDALPVAAWEQHAVCEKPALAGAREQLSPQQVLGSGPQPVALEVNWTTKIQETV